MECVIRLMRAPTLPRPADTALMARSILAMALRALAVGEMRIGGTHGQNPHTLQDSRRRTKRALDDLQQICRFLYREAGRMLELF